MKLYAQAEQRRPLTKNEKKNYTELKKLYWLHRGFYFLGFASKALLKVMDQCEKIGVMPNHYNYADLWVSETRSKTQK